ncbi:BRCA1-associated protein 2-domain-containing protein [Kalaharituber pfeilii]|nr:BRCA1-associated protein 2-domain-containing protein [Kalaharituber pfeilii]
MVPPNATTNSLLKTSENATEGSTSTESSNKPLNRNRIGAVTSPPKARFVALNNKSTEFGYGVVHLYRDGHETEGLYPLPEAHATTGGSSNSHAKPPVTSSSLSNTIDAKQQPQSQSPNADDEPLRTVAILAVPSYMTASDFMGFVGEKTRENVSHFRMIKTGKVNRYMVLMRFRQADAAREFVRLFNGKVFNSMEPENCHVVFIKSVQFISPTAVNSMSSEKFPESMINDPFSLSPAPGQDSVSAAATISPKPAPPPTPSLVELPTCPVCLERMDETTGLLTILCQHVFHCACLSKWKDSSCPVCRYSQAGVVGRGRGNDENDNEEFCNVCGADSNLWICLICGHIGCGRYDAAHAFQHYQATSHAYAMDVDTQRVWDYAGDGYVHRLIQNKSDGKLVELPSALSSTYETNANSGEYVPREKLDNIGMEYTYLLTSQLESQRAYFEEKVAQAADKAASASRDAEKATANAAHLESELKALKSKHDTLLDETIPQLTKDKDRAERKVEKLSEMAKRLEKEWKEEKTMNTSLLEKVDYLTKQSEERKKENEELKEQLRDVMFFLEARDKLKEEGEDVQEGTVTVAGPPEKKGNKKKKGKGRK